MSRSVIILLSFLFIVGCSYRKTTLDEVPISFGGVSIGYTEKEIIKIMGEATSFDTKANIKEIYYKGSNGPNAIFILENNKLKEAHWYPSIYDGKVTIPMKKEDIDISTPHNIEKVDCYEWTTCSNYIFERGEHELQIQLDWEDKVIDRVILKAVK